MKRRLILLSAAALLSVGGLSAATSAGLSAGERGSAKFAALSLIGDSINVVTFQPTVGSNMGRNIHQSVATPGGPFDLTALVAIQASIKDRLGLGEVLLYRSPISELFGEPAALFKGSKLVLPPGLIAGMKNDGATHLLLLTRNSQEARLAVKQGAVGSGRLEGIGFYVDRQQRVCDTNTRECGVGFLAPYTYLQLSLVDLSNAQVLQQQTISGSGTISSTRSDDGFDPWKALSPERKISTLEDMIKAELSQTVPVLVTPK